MKKLRILYCIAFAFMVLGMGGVFPVSFAVGIITSSFKMALISTILGVFLFLLGLTLIILYNALIQKDEDDM